MNTSPIAIEDPQVLDNLQVVLKVLKKIGEESAGAPSVSLCINRKTGKLKQSTRIYKGWSHIRIQLTKGKEGYLFEFFGENPQLFRISDFSDSSIKILNNTLKTLTAAIAHFKNERPSEALKHISHMDFALLPEWTEDKDVLHLAWHPIDRLKTEELLIGKEPGTYLFRRDRYTEILEMQLRKCHQFPIICITLSFIDKNEHLIEKTVVKKSDGWLVYNDDVSLKGKGYKSLKDLLRGDGDIVKSCVSATEHIL